jgi:trehalose 6-phosphate phosphatase
MTLPLPPVPSTDWAYFLDFDGTLVELAASPDAIEVPPSLVDLLSCLSQRTAGALALVSGRAINALDRHLATLNLPAAGQHGLEYRLDCTKIQQVAVDQAAFAAVRREFGTLAEGDKRLLLEDKGMSVGLHYRHAPEREDEILALARRLEQAADGNLTLLASKALAEFRPVGTDKGTAIARFREAPPFAGRTPVFIGDDRTDEDGFRLINQAGGLSIRVGSAADSAARYELPDVPAVHRWLQQAVTAEP